MSRVAVSLVGYRSPDDLEGSLAALAASTHDDFEVAICENGGAAAREELVRRLPSTLSGGQSVTILPYEGNSGYAGGNNRCVAATPNADCWWILNPDARPAPDAMALLVECLDADRADAVGGTLLKSDGTVQAYGGRWVPLLGRGISMGNGRPFDRQMSEQVADLDYIVGASIMFTRAFLERAGPMRDDYFLYGEEIEWGLRARSRGLRLGVQAAAKIEHSQGATTGDGGSFADKPRLPVYLDQRNKLLVLRDTRPALLVPGALGALFALTVRAAKHRAWRQFGYGLAGWAAGIANRRGKPDWLTPG